MAQIRDAFLKAMDDDLNTKDGVYRLLQLTESIPELRGMSAAEGRATLSLYRDVGRILGLFQNLG